MKQGLPKLIGCFSTPMKLVFYIGLILSSYVSQVLGQATINPGGNPTDTLIIQRLMGNGIGITNPSLERGNRNTQIATFTNGITGAGLGIDQGVLFSTGNAVNDLTTRNVRAVTSVSPTNTGTDPNLIAINPSAAFNTVAYSFDINLAPEMTGIRIVFQVGSEEYPDYVGSMFNDLFGFFVSGPGIGNGTTYENFAKLPSNNDNIAVNSVNGGVVGDQGNSNQPGLNLNQTEFYINNGHRNDGGPNTNPQPGPFPVHIEYNGITREITRDIGGLIGGQTYRFKVAIADVGDGSYDSGVLLHKIIGLREADLSIEKTVSNPTPVFGEVVTFNIKATNQDIQQADSVFQVQATDLLPSGYTFISAIPSQGTYSPTTGLWDIGAMAIGGEEVLVIKARVNPSGDYRNMVSILANDAVDIDQTDNFDEVSVTPIPPDPGLSFAKTGVLSADSNSVEYTFIVTNIGNMRMTNVEVTDPKITDPIILETTTLAPGESTTGTANYTITQAEKNAGVVLNVATVTGTPPFDPANPEEPGQPITPIPSTPDTGNPNTPGSPGVATEVEVPKAIITGITFSGTSFVYDGTAKSLAISGTPPAGTVVNYSNNNSQTNVGVYEVTVTISGSHYEDLELTADLEITPATITGVTFDGASFVYDGTAKSLAISGTLPTGTEVNYSSNNSQTDVGVQQVTATVSGSNYEDLELTADLEVTPAIITGVTFSGESFVYDGTAKSLAISGALPAGTNVVYSNNSQTDVGVQEVTATISGSNYQTLPLTATLEITPATITGVTFDGASFVYDGTARSLAISGTLPAGTEVVYENNSRADVGVQTVTARIGGANYQTLELSAELRVTPADIRDVDGFDISFTDGAFMYNGLPHSLVLRGSMPAGTTVSYINNERKDVGSQTATALITGSNYQPLELTAELSVTPAVITGVTLADGSFIYDGTEHKLVISGTLPVGASVNYTDNGRTHAGEQLVTAVISGANYQTLELVARLVVAKATQTITLDAPAQVSRDAGSVQLTVSASSGLPVSLTLDDPMVAALDGTSLDILRLGRVRITASQAGDANYETAAAVSVEVQVVHSANDPGPGPDQDINVRTHQAMSPNGDGINDFMIIEGIADYPVNRVTIFNRNGNLLWEGNDYDNARVRFEGKAKNGQQLPGGTYFYILEVQDAGVWKHKKGFFMLKY